MIYLSDLSAITVLAGKYENIAGSKLVATRKAMLTPMAAMTPSCDIPTNFVGTKARKANAVEGAVSTSTVPIPRETR